MHATRTVTPTSIRSATAAILAAVATLAVASSVLAVDYGPTQILRTAPSGVHLRVGDIAAHETDGTVAVVWEEIVWNGAGPAGSRSIMRVSDDHGATFDPKTRLREGRHAIDPRVSVCDAGIFAVSTWPTASGGSKVGVDYRGDLTILGSDHFATARGVNPDVACSGHWLGIAWFDDSTDPAHAMVTLRYLTDKCPGDCTMSQTFDLGVGHIRRDMSVAIDGDWAYVAWRSGGMRLKRFHLAHGDAAVDISPRPTQTVVDSSRASFPHLAADGTDVGLAYTDRGDTRVRMSTDRGRTFGAPTILYEAPCTDCGAGSVGMSIDMLDSYILVEALPFGDNTNSIGFLSDDGFDTWSESSPPSDSRQVGALLYDGNVTMVAEARDNRVFTYPGDPGPAHQRIRFRTGLVP